MMKIIYSISFIQKENIVYSCPHVNVNPYEEMCILVFNSKKLDKHYLSIFENVDLSCFA